MEIVLGTLAPNRGSRLVISGNTRRVIAAGAIGNVLEWYDFAIYGYFLASAPNAERSHARISPYGRCCCIVPDGPVVQGNQ